MRCLEVVLGSVLALTSCGVTALALEAAPAATVSEPFDASLDGVKSPYTDKLIALGRDWVAKTAKPSPSLASADPSASLGAAGTRPIQLQCYNTPGSKSYVGMRAEMTVDAPVARVDEVVAKIDEYQKLFPGFKDIHIVKKEGNRWLTAWEQIIPVFFISNLRYQLWYLVDHRQPERPVYRFQLKEAGSLRTFDGIIALEADGSGHTRYTEYDFFDADYGMLETLAPGKIWTGSVEDALLSDLGIKYRAEHADWTFDQIHKEADKMVAKFPVDEVAAARKPL